MVKKMNKKEFIKALQEKTNYNEDKCIIINNVLENNSFVGKKNSDKIINDLMINSFTEEEAHNIYNIAKEIIFKELKNKLKHPFKSQN